MKINSITANMQLYLIGGGSLQEGKTLLIENDIVKSFSKKKISILMINYAHSITGKKDYTQKFENYYNKSFPEYSITFNQLQITDTGDLLKNKFHTADIIYLGGGSTIRLYNTIKKHNIYEEIIQQMKKGKIVVGRSAGALIFSEFYLTGGKNKRMQLRKGFGLIPGIMCAHFTQRGREKVLIQKTINKKTLGLGIDEGAAVKIKNNTIKPLATSLSSVHIYNTGNKKNIVKEISIHSFFSSLNQ